MTAYYKKIHHLTSLDFSGKYDVELKGQPQTLCGMKAFKVHINVIDSSSFDCACVRGDQILHLSSIHYFLFKSFAQSQLPWRAPSEAMNRGHHHLSINSIVRHQEQHSRIGALKDEKHRDQSHRS